MKQRVLCIVLSLCLIASVPLTAHAVEPRLAAITPSISFYGEEASCTVQITAIDDGITAIIKLWENGNCIKTWNASATDVLVFNRRVAATSGCTYYLTVDATINGNPRARVSSTPVTCP